ncbi:hypothetical protein FRC20_006600, partial [Serendipita sp. 405]
AIINVILVINPDKDVARWHIVPNFLLCKLYVFSLLWTLEYRRRIILSEWSDNKRPVEQPHAQQGNGGKKEVRSSSDDTSEAIDARGGNAGASPAALAGAAGGSGRKRGVEDLVERAGGKATRYPIRMEVITDEQGERRTSLGFLNRVRIFSPTLFCGFIRLVDHIVLTRVSSLSSVPYLPLLKTIRHPCLRVLL